MLVCVAARTRTEIGRRDRQRNQRRRLRCVARQRSHLFDRLITSLAAHRMPAHRLDVSATFHFLVRIPGRKPSLGNGTLSLHTKHSGIAAASSMYSYFSLGASFCHGSCTTDRGQALTFPDSDEAPFAADAVDSN